MKIKEYVKVYYSQPEEERDINEWCPVLDAFIGSFCLKYPNIYTQEDRVQIAWIGAIKAINTFDITKGIQFTTYLGNCIHNEILMAYRKNNRKYQPFFVSLSEPIAEDESLTIEDMISDNSYLEYDNMIDMNKWNYFIDNLCNAKEKMVLERRMKGLSQLEISEEFGWSGQAYVSRVLKKCKNRFVSMHY